LTLQGNYTADVPFKLPPYFFLVLNGAVLTATSTFVPPVDYQVSTSNSMLGIVVSQSMMNGVIGVGPRSTNIINCPRYPSTVVNDVRPPGIFFSSAGNNIVDSITVNGCGGNKTANIYVLKTSFVEIANSVITNSQQRGIWIIGSPSFAVVHHCEIAFYGAFGIDLDANSGPKNLFYANRIYGNDGSYRNNTREGIFIEQGSQFSVIHKNSLGPGNVHGVAFYPNNFVQASTTNHHVLSNSVFGNFGAGIQYGSAVTTTNSCVATNSYILNNVMTNNGLFSAPNGYGWRRNGPVSGMYIANNADADGMTGSMMSDTGKVFINDYFRRSKLLLQNGSRAVAAVPGTALNATFSGGKLSVLGGSTPPVAYASTCSGINAAISAQFLTLANLPKLNPPFLNAPVWIWATSSSMTTSFLTVTGSISCDVPIALPSSFALVLKDATIYAQPGLTSVFAAASAHYSAVVSTSSTSTVQCGGVGASAVSIHDSAYFTVDSLRAFDCGSTLAGAVDVVNTPGADPKVANNTLLNNVMLNRSLFNGVQVNYGSKVMVNQATIIYSGNSGLSVTNSIGTLIADSVVAYSRSDGVAIFGPSNNTVLVGSSVYGSGGVGVNFTNNNATAQNANSVLLSSSLYSNTGGSVIFSASTLVSGILSATVAGNVMYGNGRGIEIDGLKGSVQKLTMIDNKDMDGAAPKLGASVKYSNYRLDPYGRFSVTASLSSPSPVNPIGGVSSFVQGTLALVVIDSSTASSSLPLSPAILIGVAVAMALGLVAVGFLKKKMMSKWVEQKGKAMSDQSAHYPMTNYGSFK